MNHILGLALVFGLFVNGGVAAQGSEYPDKPVRVIVGFTPGGGLDILARIVAEKLGKQLRTQIIVDNRPGAGTTLAVGLAARAPADGYTLLMVNNSFTINPNLYSRVPYDPIKDFTSIAKVASAPFLLVVHPSLPAHSIKELLALARAKPGQLNYSTGGNGSTGHLAGEVFKSMAGVQIQHIPYKGAAPALADLIGGAVDMMMVSLPSASAVVISAKVRVLAVTTAKRTSFLPNIPTVDESGVNGYDVEESYGMLAPSGTPNRIIGKLNAGLLAFMSKPEPALLERFAFLGMSPLTSSPEEFGSYIKIRLALWKNAIDRTNAKVE